METRELRALLARVAEGEASVDEAELALRTAPFTDLGWAKVDHHRGVRQGVSEVVYGAGKTAGQIADICRALAAGGQERVLVTRLDEEKAGEVERLLSQGGAAAGDGPCAGAAAGGASSEAAFRYHALPRLGILGGLPLEGDQAGCILWCCTEMNSREEIDALVDAVQEVCGK